MTRYEGLELKLRLAVLGRDHHRCRWCGTTNRSLDLHHIRYRRGSADDVAENLIALCRAHHDFVHGGVNGAGQTITKSVAQMILFELVDTPGTTGSSLWRRHRRRWALEGKCLAHGLDACLECGLKPGA